jgi:CTP:phosphocholine cytidylyltransferase-like protein
MNAIILAAGTGSRLTAITTNTPKALIEIDNEPIIERQIRYLHETGIKDIHVVVGYKALLFDYLVSKYNVHLIYNEHYLTCNNLYSLCLAKHVLSDTYILDSDIFLTSNFLKRHLNKSTYFSLKKEELDGEWILDFSGNQLRDIIIYDEIKDSSVSFKNGAYIISGVSYWANHDAPVILNYINSIFRNGKFIENGYSKMYWDEIIYKTQSKLSINIHPLKFNDLCEIDNLQDYLRAKSIASNYHANTFGTKGYSSMNFENEKF